jgi:hypothetical protein
MVVKHSMGFNAVKILFEVLASSAGFANFLHEFSLAGRTRSQKSKAN